MPFLRTRNPRTHTHDMKTTELNRGGAEAQRREEKSALLTPREARTELRTPNFELRTPNEESALRLDAGALKLLHDIGNLRAMLRAPRSPMLGGDLRAALRRTLDCRARLAQLETEWLNRGLAAAGMPLVPLANPEPLRPAPGQGRRPAPPVQRAPQALELPGGHAFK